MMHAYQNVALVYDYLMSDIDYDTWFRHYQMQMQKSAPVNRVLEIGCGTGNFTRRLVEYYDVYAVDNSPQMIKIAQKKLTTASDGHHVVFECADMGCFEASLPLFDAAVAVFDVLNYAHSVDRLKTVFMHVASKLRTGGSFVFDVNSEAAFRLCLFDEDSEDPDSGCSHVWRGVYDEETHLEHIEMKYYRNGKFWFGEQQVQRAHSEEEITEALQSAGFEQILILDAMKMTAADEKSDRWLVSAVKM